MIEQILVGSTANVTPKTMQEIEDNVIKVSTMSGAYGCFIAVLDDPELEKKLITNQEIILLTSLAREHGCTWVYLDPDIDPIEMLPDYSDQWN